MKQRCTCDCGCELVRNHLSTHKKTLKHIKFMDWIAKGLDPKEELAREEREWCQQKQRMHDYFNGGRERDWLNQLDWEANLPSYKDWVEEQLKKKEHLPEYANFKDNIKAIREKLFNPPEPPMSEEERARIRARQLAPITTT